MKTVYQVAMLLQINVHKIYDLIHRGDIKAKKTLLGKWLIDKDEIEKLKLLLSKNKKGNF